MAAFRASRPGGSALPEPLRILLSFAHPDDESFGPAALLAKYARDGAQIHGLFATNGACGRTDLKPRPSAEELGDLREADLRAVASLVGLASVTVLDYGVKGEVKAPSPFSWAPLEPGLRPLHPSPSVRP